MSAALSAFFTVRTWSSLDLSAVIMFWWSLSVTVNIINLLILLVYTDRIPLAVDSLLGHQLKSDPLVWLQRQRQNVKICPKIWCDSANLDHGALPFPSDRRWGLSAEPDVVPERRSSLSFQKSLYNHTIITPEGVAFLQLDIIHSRLVDERFHCGRKNQKSWFLF